MKIVVLGGGVVGGLRRLDPWTAPVAACPPHAHLLEVEPVSDVYAVSGIAGTTRHTAAPLLE